MTVEQVEAMLSGQEKRWWSVKIQSSQSKDHFLKYDGRYVKRPPMAQRRITHIGHGVVRFWVEDKKLGQRVWKCNAHWKSSSIVGPNTFQNVMCT